MSDQFVQISAAGSIDGTDIWALDGNGNVWIYQWTEDAWLQLGMERLPLRARPTEQETSP